MASVTYVIGKQCERVGDFEGATRWFRHAAETGCPQAALRLGDLLGRLVDEDRAETWGSPELLLAESTRWLSEVHFSAVPDAIELVTDTLDRHQRLAARRGAESIAAD